jgi:hypothetical protein
MTTANTPILANFIAEMNINFDPYKESVASAMTRGRYEVMPDQSPLINPNGYIGRYQLSADALQKLGILKNSSQSKASITNDASWVQIADTTSSIQGEVLAPFFDNRAIFSFADSPQLVPTNHTNFLLDKTLQDNCFIAHTYMNYLQLKSSNIITGTETPAERAGWLNVMEFSGLGQSFGILAFRIGMVLPPEIAQLITQSSGALGLYVNWKILKKNPNADMTPDPVGYTPYKYYTLGSSTQ